MKKKITAIWTRAAPVRRWIVSYAEDLLMLGGGVCFVAAAAEQLGRPAALTVAGCCMAVYAMLIARAKRGGTRK